MGKEGDAEVSHVDSTEPTANDTSNGKSVAGKALVADAQSSARLEHSLTVSEAIRAYPMALFWCFAVSLCVIMEGYDQILVQSLFAYPTFQKQYGRLVGQTSSGAPKYELSAAWQAGLGNSSAVGAFFGVWLNGYIVHRFGHRKVLLVSLIAMGACIFITFFSKTVGVLCVGQILAGIPWGIFASAAPAFASEVLPMVLRVYLTSWTNMCFCIGQLIAAGVLRGLSVRDDEWGFRIPFAIQWAWLVILFPLLWFAPESPWHAVRQGRYEDAEKALRRLQRASADVDPKKTLAAIIYTNQLEQDMEVGTTYWDCFKSFELRRTEIACMTFIGHVTSGSNFAYNSSYFFSQLGLDTATVYDLNIGGLSLAFLGTIINWVFCMPYFGRRTLYLWGMFTMSVTLLIIGVLNPWTLQSRVGWSQAILAMFWNLIFDMTVGQLGWALPAEVGSTRLRQKTVCVARNSYYLVNIVAGVLQPYFMNPTAWNLKGYTGFFWGGTALLHFVWAYFRLPETKNRTYDELDILFSQRVPARKFKAADIDAYE